MIRFDTALLARVDRAARRRGVSRSAWVAFTLSKALDDEEAAG
jgi:metal-responsive CopG/Arc/MetJ family transcriptional regulator